MTVNIQGLEHCIKQSNIGKRQLAAEIGMDQATFYRKMRSDGEKFTIGEMHKMVDVLNMTKEHAANIFLFENSHYCE